MKDNKDLNGRYHRIVKEKGGNYGIETVVIEKGKVTSTEFIEPNYPTITLSKFGKKAFEEASEKYDKESQL